MLLHINGNYPNHSLHSELVSQLADMGFQQVVCVPLGDEKNKSTYRLNRPDVSYACDVILTSMDRVFFIRKVKKITNYIENHVDMTKVNCILAHTVFSDGAAAYRLHQKHRIPYSVVVRDTDVNFHMKYRRYLLPMMRKIIKNARNVVFIGPSYISLIEKKLKGKQQKNFNCKTLLIPNAVNSFWFSQKPQTKSLTQPLRIVYVGDICKRKNVPTTIKLVKKLNDLNVNTVFDIVGDGVQRQNCIDLARELQVDDKVFIHGWKNKKDDIKYFYDTAHLFVMLSFKETFGTTYIEAISQGLPILYTEGQGVDGYFKEGSVGYRCDPQNVDGATEKVFSILDNYKNISQNCIEESKKFCWENVAEKYAAVINNMLNQFQDRI